MATVPSENRQVPQSFRPEHSLTVGSGGSANGSYVIRDTLGRIAAQSTSSSVIGLNPSIIWPQINIVPGAYSIAFEINQTSFAGDSSHISDTHSFTVVPVAKPAASLVSPSANATGLSLTPTLAIGYSNSKSGSPYGFNAFDYRVRRKSDGHMMRNSKAIATSDAQATAKRAAVLYGGSALSLGIPYELSVRVQDAWAYTWSDWTAWITFTPSQLPLVPTAQLPSGLQTSLTPTIGMTYHAGEGGYAMASWRYRVLQGGILIYDSGDITASVADGGSATQVYGTANPGGSPSTPPWLQWGTAYTVQTMATDTNAGSSSWADATSFRTEATPLAPSMLAPNGAITAATSPVLAWQHNSPDSVAQSKVRIWLQTGAGVAVTGYNPKELAQATFTHTVSETLTISPATAYVWWVETIADTGPGWSPASAHATFTVSPGPSISLTNITDGIDWLSSTLTVAHDIDAASGTTLASRSTTLYAADAATVIETSGDVITSGTHEEGSYTFTARLANGSRYYIRASVTDSNGSMVSTSLIEIDTAFTLPDAITGVSAEMIGGSLQGAESAIQPLPGVLIVWDAVVSVDAFLRYVIYRHSTDADVWVQVSHAGNATQSNWVDYAVACGESYTYAVTQVRDDGGGGELESLIVGTAQLTISFGAVAYMHVVDDPARYVEVPLQSRRLKARSQTQYLWPYNASTPIAYTSNTQQRTVDCTITVPALSGYIEKIDAIETLCGQQAQEGLSFMYRDSRGLLLYCLVDSNGYTRTDSNGTTINVTLSLAEIVTPEE